MTTLAEQLGIDDGDWMGWAACRDIPFDPQFHPMFDGYEAGGTAERKAVDSLCYTCPVQKICGEYAMSRKEEGVWGGVYWTPAGRPDPVKNSHKTDEEWASLGRLFEKRIKPVGNP